MKDLRKDRASYPDTPHERIYLQYYGDEEPSEGPAMEVSWCAEKIYEHDVEYVRRDLVRGWRKVDGEWHKKEPSHRRIAAEEREAIAAWAQSNAAEMRSREPGSDWLQNMRAASISTLEEVARAIRSGEHRREEAR